MSALNITILALSAIVTLTNGIMISETKTVPPLSHYVGKLNLEGYPKFEKFTQTDYCRGTYTSIADFGEHGVLTIVTPEWNRSPGYG